MKDLLKWHTASKRVFVIEQDFNICIEGSNACKCAILMYKGAQCIFEGEQFF